MTEAAGIARPTKAEIAAAAGARVPDVIGPSLRVLFCGINPGLYSGAVGHHFARPGNRFWKVLRRAGFTRRELSAFEERQLLDEGVGITNLAARATATAAEIGADELRDGVAVLARKVRRTRPLCTHQIRQLTDVRRPQSVHRVIAGGAAGDTARP